MSMSKWNEVESQDIEIDEDGETLNILAEVNNEGNVYAEVKIRDVLKIINPYAGKCKWEKDNLDYDQYKTSCGNMFVFFEGSPEDNKMKFCPYCGKEIDQNA
jgi:hypothetical protein